MATPRAGAANAAAQRHPAPRASLAGAAVLVLVGSGGLGREVSWLLRLLSGVKRSHGEFCSLARVGWIG